MLKKLVTGIVILMVLGTGAYFYASNVSSTIKVSRTIDAPADRVWALWNDADVIKRWWGPKGYTAPVVKNDFRVGGTFLLSMRAPSGETHYNSGTYTDIALNKKIVSRMSFSTEDGTPIPAAQAGLPGRWPDAVEILVEFSDQENGQKTRIEITETGIPLIMSVFARMGWEQQFDKFEQIVKTQ